MLITFLNQSGGCGKTTLTVHLACWLAERGVNVVVLDADPQARTKAWLERAAPNLRVLPTIDVPQITRAVDVLKDQVDVILADSKPGLDAPALRLLKLSDRILMPIIPSLINVHATEQAIATMNAVGAFRDHQQNYEWGILSMVDEANGEVARVRTRLALMEFNQATAFVSRRTVFPAAYREGTVAWRMKGVGPAWTRPAALAAKELDLLFNEVLPNGLREIIRQAGARVGGNDASGQRAGGTGTAGGAGESGVEAERAA
jgi:chromosome partitioning protein